MNTSMAYLGLGANLADPLQQLVDARSAIYRLDESIRGRCSRFYRSSPVGYDAQPDFINCVLELETSASAFELLDAIQIIETRLGRQRVATNKNAPRTIDIDILLFGSEQIETPRLCVPHPRMNQRLFVLKPLSEFKLSNPKLEIYRFNQTEFPGQILHCLSID